MTAEEFIRKIEVIYGNHDVAQLESLFHPDFTAYLNGKPWYRSREQILDEQPKYWATVKDNKLQGTARAVTDDTIAVEWHSTWTEVESSQRREGYGGSFYRMKEGRILEWRAYITSYALA
jgi:ketosteroid isomerase-like protein